MNNNIPATFNELIDQWPSLSELAIDMGLPYANVHRWKSRNSIPAEHWDKLLEVAKRRKIRVSPRELITMASA